MKTWGTLLETWGTLLETWGTLVETMGTLVETWGTHPGTSWDTLNVLGTLLTKIYRRLFLQIQIGE